MSDRKAAYERENDSLKAEIERMTRSHSDQVNALQDEISRLRSRVPEGIKTLFGAYPNLRYLLELLKRVNDLADPISSVAYDREVYVSADSKSTRPMEGQGTERDRDRQVWAGEEIAVLARTIERSIRPVDDDRRTEVVGSGPVCWRRKCKGRGRHQSWDNEVCRWCGHEFGRYKRWRDPDEVAAATRSQAGPNDPPDGD